MSSHPISKIFTAALPALLIAGLVGLLMSSAAQGRASRIAPSTTKAPSARVLIARARAAISSKRTVHIVSRSTYMNPQVQRIVVQEQEGITYRPVGLHSFTTQSTTSLNVGPHPTAARYDEVVLIGGHLAERSGKQAPWTCSKSEARHFSAARPITPH